MGTVTMDTLTVEKFGTRYYRSPRDRSASPRPTRVHRRSPARMGEAADTYNIPFPLQNIGCQNLLDYKYTHSGWVRKRRDLLNKLFNWPQAYVVLHEGCLYYFKNEKAKSASGKFSLYGYSSVFRASEVPRKEAPWAFKIVHSHTEYKTYYFAASSEQEMKLWMSRVKKEMLWANGKSATYGVKVTKERDDVNDNFFYQDIETDIYDGVHVFVPSQDYQKQCSIKKQNEQSDDEDLIDKRPPQPLPVDQDPFCTYRKTIDVSNIDPPHEAELATRLAPPTPPRQRRGHARDEGPKSPMVSRVKDMSSTLEAKIPLKPPGKSQRPKLNRRGSYEKTELENGPATSSPNHHVDFTQINLSGGGSTGEEDHSTDVEEYWASIHFDDNDKHRAHDIITAIGEDGVYLVRPENVGTGKVLVVWAQGKAKKYRIQLSASGDYYLATTGFHDKCLENLLCYYYEQQLPTVETKLKIPYKLHHKYKSLQL